MFNLTILLLGRPQFFINDTKIENFHTRKDCALLAYLAVTGTIHSRETLASLFWSELSEKSARRNLRNTLSYLQKVIGPQWFTVEHGVGLAQGQPWWVDVHTLRTTVQNLPVNPILNTTLNDQQALTELEQLLNLYRGEFLQGFHLQKALYFEEWMLAQREELRLLALHGLEVLFERCSAQGAYAQGLAATRRLLQIEPWSELGYRAQMRLLVQNGQRVEALAQFEKCREVLATELGVEPDPATVALYEQIRDWATGGTDQPVLTLPVPATVVPQTKRVPTIYHNLPRQLTFFLGRDDDIASIRNLLLSPRHHLVTVVGEGGIGKTRLALALAQSFVEAAQDQPAPAAAASRDQPAQLFPDGIGYVALSGLANSETLVDQLIAAVAKALRIQFGSREPLLQQLQDWLRDKALLLLFDNIEHLLPLAADFLVELLQSAPRLKIVATSRLVLNLQAESTVRLAGLPLPPLKDLSTMPLPTLLTYSSVALFVERAQHANPTFQLIPTNQEAVAQICLFVAGLPLAIELAATQVRQYSCQQILAELRKSYRVLSSTLRDLAPRHRSIGGLLDYSWQFLSPETASLLAACSIFRGTFDRAAAAAILGATPEHLFTIVDHSLFQWVASGDNPDQYRFALHELIRQYGMEQLQTQPAEVHRLHAAHCHYYLTLLIEQSRIFVHDLRALQRMQNEIDNLHAAWEWAVTQGELELLVTSAYPLRQFYTLLGMSHKAETIFRRAIVQVEQIQAPSHALWIAQKRAIATMQIQRAHFCYSLDQSTVAEQLAETAIGLGQQLADHAIQGLAYLCLSTFLGRRAEWKSARRAAEQSLLHARAAAAPQIEVQSLQNIGCAYVYGGDPVQGLDYLSQALALYHRAATSAIGRNLYVEGLICLDLGRAYQNTGNLMQARAYYQQSVEIYQRMNISLLGTHALWHLSSLHLQLGLFTQARSEAQMALELCRSISNRDAEGSALSNLVYAHYQLGEWDKADQVCQLLFDRIKPLGLVFFLPFAYLLQGELRRNQGQWQAALEAYTTAKQEYAATEQHAQAVSTQAKIAQVWQQLGNLPRALTQVEEILPNLSQTLQNGWLETTTDYWLCYQVLAAAGDPRAAALLQRGYQYIQEQANHITDNALRHAYLTNVKANRAILELARP